MSAIAILKPSLYGTNVKKNGRFLKYRQINALGKFESGSSADSTGGAGYDGNTASVNDGVQFIRY